MYKVWVCSFPRIYNTDCNKHGHGCNGKHNRCKILILRSSFLVWSFQFKDLLQSVGIYYLEDIIVPYFHDKNTSCNINMHCYSTDYDTYIFLIFLFCRYLGFTSLYELSFVIIIKVPLCPKIKTNKSRSITPIYRYNGPDSTLIFKALFLYFTGYIEFQILCNLNSDAYKGG